MPAIAGNQQVFIQQARVISVDTRNRTVAVKWDNQETSKSGVHLLTDPNSFSAPRVGDIGLVIGTRTHYYWVGKLDQNYANKIDGKVQDQEIRKPVRAKDVQPGEVYLTNTPKKTWLNLSNGGDFSFMNGFVEGLRYMASTRHTQLLGTTTEVIGNGVRAALGNVLRVIPPMGEQPVPGIYGGKAIEALLEVAYQGAAIARLHMGTIVDKVTGVVPELSTLGAPLLVILEATASAVKLASLKFDNLGNVELKSESPAGKVIIDSTLPVGGMQLGGITAVNPVILGTVFLTALQAYYNAVSAACVAAAVPDPTGTASATAFTAINVATQTLVTTITTSLTANGLPLMSPKVYVG